MSKNPSNHQLMVVTFCIVKPRVRRVVQLNYIDETNLKKKTPS